MGRNFGFFPFFKLMLSTGLIVGIISGLLLGCFIFIPALLQKRKINRKALEKYKAEEYEIQQKIDKLTIEIVAKDKERINLESYVDNLKNSVDNQYEYLTQLRNEENKVQKSITSLAETEERVRANMETAIEKRSEMLANEYRDTEMAFIEEYASIRKEAVEGLQKAIKEKKEELWNVDTLISDKKEIYKAILADEQRKAKEKAERDFYMLNILEEDLNEIEKIREITPYLKNPEVLNKVLWSSYYQKPYQELIARLFNTSKPSGIYKITCLPDNKIYIGQSVNVPNRFSEHIKRGLGAEPATKNRLYTAMKKWGVENFTFELMEEVSRDKLNERERYWIDYFQSAEYDIGLNGNKGVKE